MPPTTISMGVLSPVIETIYKKLKGDRKVSTSVTKIEKEKSKSVPYIAQCEYGLEYQKPFRNTEGPSNKKHIGDTVFDFNRILREERKEFEFRLANIPQASGSLDDFLLKGELARGTFGRVHLAEDVMDKKNYAIKIISKDGSYSTDVDTERDYLYAANSPFIVSLIQHFEDDQAVYLVQEYVSNGDIFSQLRHSGPFSEELAKFYTAQVVLALEYMHNVNLIYRDLKPENIMVDSNGYIKLVDFGLVKRTKGKTKGSMVGTHAYMAPEVILQKSYDKSIDWWSLGILIYEMFAGCQKTPFYDHNTEVMRGKIVCHKEVSFPSSYRIPPVARDLIKRLLKVNPNLRLGTGIKGSEDVKKHPWFNSITWVDLYRKAVLPPKKRTSIYKSSNKFFK